MIICAASARHRADTIASLGSVARSNDTDDNDPGVLVRVAPGATLFDQAGLELHLEELLGYDIDVVATGGLQATHRSTRQNGITL